MTCSVYLFKQFLVARTGQKMSTMTLTQNVFVLIEQWQLHSSPQIVKMILCHHCLEDADYFLLRAFTRTLFFFSPPYFSFAG